MGLRITTWNVNGIRNPFGYQPWREKRTFEAMFGILEADIVIMQETKIQRKDLRDDMVLVPGWDVFFSLPKHKKGYSGVAIYTRNAACAPIRVEEGVTGILCPPKSSTSFRDLPEDQQIGGYPRFGQLTGSKDMAELDSEGRCVILEFPAFVLFGVYSPANRDESRDDFRTGFFHALDVRIRNLVAQGKQVILTGDLNVIRSPLDSTNVAETLRKEGLSVQDWMSMPVRRIFNQLVFDGSVTGPRDEGRETPILWDLCRCFHPEREGMNTCWDTKRNTRPANNGSRIDYILCSDGLKKWFTQSNIQEGLMGSDHCPVYAVLADQVTTGDQNISLLDIVNPPGMFVDGKRCRDWSSKDLRPLSARLIPEFDRRQSIRDMFTKKATPSLSQQTSTSTNIPIEPTENGQSRDPTPSQTTDGTPAPPLVPVASLEAKTVAFSPSKPTAIPKRPAETVDTSRNRPQKKGKTAASTSGTKNKVVSGQTTLQGFFKPKTTVSQSHTSGQSSFAEPLNAVADATNQLSNQRDASVTRSMTPSQGSPTQSSKADSPGKVFDPIEAKESWSRLLSKRVAPRCEHDEPCISLTTKKPGVNCGRSFYICGRPLGPSGEKERGTEWRCGTFIWSSDWQSV